MNLSLYSYLDDRMNNERGNDRNREREMEHGYERGRNQIGFNSDFPTYDEFRDNRRSHKEQDFEEEDFQEPKSMGRYTPTGTNQAPRMPLNEFIEKLYKSFRKELCDVMRYCEMAMVADNEGFKEFAEGLNEMCYEEFTHASFLRANLKKMGRNPEEDPEVKKLWQKVSRKFEN